jgi:hypothetical protein
MIILNIINPPEFIVHQQFKKKLKSADWVLCKYLNLIIIYYREIIEKKCK